MNFSRNALNVGDIDNLRLLQNLDSHLGLGENVHANLDLSEGAFSDGLA